MRRRRNEKLKANNKNQRVEAEARGHGNQAESEGIQSEEDAEQEAEGADGRKRAKAKVPRTRGQFAPSDPPIIVNGPGFAASFKPEPTVKIRDFVRRVLANEPAIPAMQKGSSEEGLEFLTEKSSCSRPSYCDVRQRHVQILCDQTGRDEISGEKVFRADQKELDHSAR